MNLILCCYFSFTHKALHWQLIQLLSHKVMQLRGRDRESERVEREREWGGALIAVFFCHGVLKVSSFSMPI